MRARRQFALCAVGALLGGCSLAPKYRPAPPPQVDNYKEAGDWTPAAPADGLPRGSWWEAFGDPTLNELQRQLAESNPDLRAAVARFEQARGLAIRARSDIFPSVDANLSAKRAAGHCRQSRAHRRIASTPLPHHGQRRSRRCNGRGYADPAHPTARAGRLRRRRGRVHSRSTRCPGWRRSVSRPRR